MDTTITLPQEISTFYSKTFLERAKARITYDWISTPKNHNLNDGLVGVFSREGLLAAATTPLTEGVNPTAQTSTAVTVTYTVAPYGGYIKVSELFKMTSIDEGLKEKMDTIAEQAARSIDELVRATAALTTTVSRSNSRVSDVTVVATDVLTGKDFRRMSTLLDVNKAPKFESGYYRAIISAQQAFDLRGDSEWLDAYRYTDTTNAIINGEITRFHGFDIKITNNPNVTATGAAGINLYSAFFAGRGAITHIALGGKNMPEIVVKTSGAQDTSNPLNMFSTIGWKAHMAFKVLNNDWIVNFKSATAYVG